MNTRSNESNSQGISICHLECLTGAQTNTSPHHLHRPWSQSWENVISKKLQRIAGHIEPTFRFCHFLMLIFSVVTLLWINHTLNLSFGSGRYGKEFHNTTNSHKQPTLSLNAVICVCYCSTAQKNPHGRGGGFPTNEEFGRKFTPPNSFSFKKIGTFLTCSCKLCFIKTQWVEQFFYATLI